MSVTTAEVAEIIRGVSARVVDPGFRRLSPDQIHEKAPGDLVTDLDRQAESELSRLLTSAGGGIVVGEESVHDDASVLQELPTAELAWVIDPIDGTKNYVNGSTHHAVMVAEVQHGVTTRSWIWQPQLGHMWIAERGNGLVCDGEPVTSNRRHPASERIEPDVPDSAQLLSLPDSARQVAANRNVVRAVTAYPHNRRSGASLTWSEAHSCCGVDYPLICLGEQDVACWFHIHPWDHLPGALMVTECGGVVRVAGGADYTARHTEQRGVIIAASDERSWQIAAQALEEN